MSETLPPPGDEPTPGETLAPPVEAGDLGETLPPPGEETGADEAGARLPERIGPYRIEGELGRGGMGVVLRGRHVELGRAAALKLLPQGAFASERQRERFRLEAEAAARLRHPNVVAVYEVGLSEEGEPYLAMDLIEGESLEERLAREGPLAPREAGRLVGKLAQALAAAHERLILHRDLKPANVLLEGDEPLLADFGLAKLVDAEGEGLTRSGEGMGTLGFAAPEQLGGGAVDARADVYGLGATLYAALTGKPPFAGENLAQVVAAVTNETPRPPGEWVKGVDRDLETICLRCLEREPGDRYPSALALAEDLDRFAQDLPIAARRPGALERVAKWRRRNPRAFARALAGGALLLGLAGLAGWSSVQRALAEKELARANAQADLDVAQEQERVRAGLSQRARMAAEVAWARLERSTARPRPLGLALAALQSAQRWRGLEPDAPAAATALRRAGRALAEVALAREQWDLAAEAYRAAAGERPDAAGLAGDLARVADAQGAEARRRLAAVARVISQTQSGLQGERPEGLADAVFELARYPEAQTVELLCARLDDLRGALEEALLGAWREAAAPTAAEERAGLARLELEPALERWRTLGADQTLTLKDRASLDAATRRLVARAQRAARTADAHVSGAALLAGRQSAALSRGQRDLARVALEALGRLGADRPELRQLALEPLGRYLRVERNEDRALIAGRALARLGGARAAKLLILAGERFGPESRFAAQLAADALGGELDELPAEVSAFELGLRGALLLRRGEHQAACEHLERAVQRSPQAGELWVTLGAARLRAGDPAGAIAALDSAARLTPRAPGLWINRAAVAQTKGDLGGAIAALDSALALSPQNARLWEIRGNLRQRRGQAEAAERDYDAALARDPNRPGALRERGQLRRKRRDFSGALADLTRAVDLQPRDRHAWSHLGTLRRALRDYAGSVAAFDRALALDPKDAGLHHDRGLSRQSAGDLAGALHDYDRAVALAPRDPRFRRTRGVGLLMAGRDAEARADLDLALKGDDRDPYTWLYRGALRQRSGDLEGALADFSAALERDPRFLAAWNNKANVLSALGRPKQALEVAAKGLSLAPEDPHLHYVAGLAFVELSRGEGVGAGTLPERRQRAQDAARARFRRVLARAPKHLDALTNLAGLLVDAGELQEAERCLEQVLAARPHNAAAWQSRGKLRLLEGDAGDAIDAFNRALAANPRYAAAWTGRAKARLALGRTSSARKDLDRGLELDPGQPAAWRLRAACRRAEGDPEGAAADLAEFLKRFPSDPAADDVRRERAELAGG